MGSWAQSRDVTRVSWGVLKQNRYLLGFPLLGFVISLIPMALFWAPGAWLLATDRTWLALIAFVVGIFATQLVITLFSGGLVAAVDEALAGRDASLGMGLGRAFGRFGALAAWSVILTIVSFILGLVRGNGDGNVVGVILRNVLAAAAGVMWQLITFFVLPVIVLERESPINAIKASAKLFRARWGMQLSGGIRIGGLIGLIVILPSILAIIGGILLTLANLWAIGVPLIVVGVIVFAIGALLLSAMRGVFSVALYRYAKDGVIEGGFTEAQLAGAVKVKA